MKRYSYDERDYAFGQTMLTLRTTIGLTQVGLAQHLGVSRKAVGGWEAGESYPKVEHLKVLITLALRTSAFATGREEEEIRAFWKAAHQKVLLDETWLAVLLSQRPSQLAPESIDTNAHTERVRVAPAGGPRVDWGEALDAPGFYDRESELATLGQWIVQERCRVVSVLGMGGIGKSVLITNAMRQLAEYFQVVLFRSLRDAPFCEALLEDCLQQLARQPVDMGAADLERRISLLLEELRGQRVLVVFDNLESLLQAGEARGRLRPGYEGYARLLREVAERAHQSCLLLTSREKPAALRILGSRQMPVRSRRLGGLDPPACEQLLADHELVGSPEERACLIARYEGNPLALNMVAETITDLFGGLIALFLAQDTLVFGSISELLDEQVGRLSTLEQTLLYWLATLREPVTLEELRSLLVVNLPAVQVLEALDGLHRRSLIEQGQRPGSFILHSVVLEYVTDRLVEQVADEIVQGRLSLLVQHPLSQAQARDIVYPVQERLLARLLSTEFRHLNVEQLLRSLLDEVRNWAEDTQGYGPANLIALLRLLHLDLRGLDLSTRTPTGQWRARRTTHERENAS